MSHDQLDPPDPNIVKEGTKNESKNKSFVSIPFDTIINHDVVNDEIEEGEIDEGLPLRDGDSEPVAQDKVFQDSHTDPVMTHAGRVVRPPRRYVDTCCSQNSRS